MNPKRIVSLSNAIAIVSILLLLYWVFIFTSMQVFGLKIFRENLTETFYLSIVGILALLSGALIVNIMFNMTRIAEKHNNDAVAEKSLNKKVLAGFIVSFPVIFILLIGGDSLTTRKKEKLLLASASSIIKSDAFGNMHLDKYQFKKEWIDKASNMLAVMSSTDNNFNSVSIIVNDTIEGSDVFLEYAQFNDFDGKDQSIKKTQFMLSTSLQEREYLNDVFHDNHRGELFVSHDGDYKLFFPVSVGGRVFVLLFSDQQRYGKIGS
ncbi:MAG TPA: hypothetical protein PK573_06440 [Spirochaetota bacterium]|nr:hypothetical protein [Spirochaetota bacterium]HRZ28721.1 hypothetical protein [Spirochaetota bacterium]HSA14131.1 hypothetical protein [Spirochaetota bacterium]